MNIDVLVEINGQAYDGFLSFAISRDFKSLAGEFSLACAPKAAFPLEVNQTCRIVLNGEPIINGFIEKMQISYSSSAHNLIVSGRDKTCDIIDSHVGPKMSFNKSLLLSDIIQASLDQLGINNINILSNVAITPFESNVTIGADIGTTHFQFLSKFCAMKQVILTTDGDGNILLDRASDKSISTWLLNELNSEKNNISEGQAIYDFSKVFYSYTGYSTINPNSAQDAITTPYQAMNLPIKPAYNTSLPPRRHTRKYIFLPESISTVDDMNKRVQWQADTDKANAMMYACKVAGFTAETDGVLWKPNMLVNVVDTFTGVNGQFLILSVRYEFAPGNTGGATTSLTMVSPEAFKLQSDKEQEQAVVSVLGKGFVI